MAERPNLIEGIREQVKTGSIFLDRFVFSDDYKPERLIARDDQIARISELIRPILEGEKPQKPQNGFLYGLPGTGKTAVMLAFLKDMDAYMEKYDWNEVCHAYVNCHTPNLSTLLSAILWAVQGKDPDTFVPLRGLSPREYLLKIFAEVNNAGKRIIIVFDEIDKLSEKELELILYPLIRPGHMYLFKPGVSVTVIGIANNLEFLKQLDPRDESSTKNTPRIAFPKYNAVELRDILEERRQGFVDGAVDDEILSLCAALARQTGGSARTAIGLLEKAGIIAQRHGHMVVNEQHVKEAQVEIETDETVKNVSDLPTQQQTLLAAILDMCDKSGSTVFTSGPLYKRYVEISSFLDLDALTDRRIYDLTKELEQMALISITNAHRGRYGITREMTFKANRDAVIAGIMKNPRLASLALRSGHEPVDPTLDAFA